MVTRTKSHSHTYDNRRFLSTDGGLSWKSVGFSVETLTSGRVAAYPDWDYKRRLANGQNCTTFLEGFQNGYRSAPIVADIQGAFRPVRIDPAAEGWADVAIRKTRKVSGTTQVQQARVRGHVWRAGLSVPSDGSLLSSVDNAALMGFNRKVLKAQRDLEGLVVLGELGESLRMMRRPALSLRLAVGDYIGVLTKRLRSDRSYRPNVIRRIAAETWLEAAFGWTPLVNDVLDGCKALANSLHNRGPRQKVSYTAARMKTTRSAVDGPSGQNSGISYKYGRQVWRHYAAVKYYGIVGLPEFDGFDQSRFGIRWSDVLPAAWELIPYSFLVDYFTNLGEIISGFSSQFTDVRWVARGQCTVDESSWDKVELGIVPDSLWNTEVLHWTPGSRVYKVRRTLIRDTYTGSRVPRLEFDIPGLKSKKWINISALTLLTRRAHRAVAWGEKRFWRSP